MGDVHLISGNDEFAVKNKAAEVIRKLCGDNPEENQSLEIVRGDDDSMKSDAVIGELVQCVDTPPFLSPDKTVWLKNYSSFDGDSKRDTASLEKLTELIKKGVPDDVTLVISGALTKK